MWRSAAALTMTWSQPDFWSMFATSFAVMGARLLSFLSWRAYGKSGRMAVMRFALAILQAWIMMQTSMSAVLTSPHPVLMMYTSSSRTDSIMRTWVSPIPLFVTSALPRETPSLQMGNVQPSHCERRRGCMCTVW